MIPKLCCNFYFIYCKGKLSCYNNISSKKYEKER